MDSHVAVDDVDIAEDLLRELQEDDGLKGHVRLIERPPASGSMGVDLTSVLVVAVGSGGAVTALASALIAWLKRPRGIRVHVKVVGPDGASVEIDGDRIEDVESLIRATLWPPTHRVER